MSKNNVIDVESTVKDSITDGLTDLIRRAAKAAIASAVETELGEFLSGFQDLKLEDGKLQVVRNGYHPERKISTGVGQVDVCLPRVRDRKANSNISFKSSLIPP